MGRNENIYWITWFLAVLSTVIALIWNFAEAIQILFIGDYGLFHTLILYDIRSTIDILNSPLFLIVSILPMILCSIYSCIAIKKGNNIRNSTIILFIIPISILNLSLLFEEYSHSAPVSTMNPGPPISEYEFVRFGIWFLVISYFIIILLLSGEIQIKSSMSRNLSKEYMTIFDRFHLGAGKLISRYYLKVLPVIFNLFIFRIYESSLYFVVPHREMEIIMKSLFFIILTVPVYTCFIMGFEGKDKMKIRLLCFYTGGFISVVQILLFIYFRQPEIYFNTICIFLIIVLIASSFIGREFGLMGYRWKKRIESYEAEKYKQGSAWIFY